MSDQLAVFIDFENVAIWAEEHFFDLELNRLMEYLQSRGPVVVKRAYADWTRFSRYRDDLLANSIDLVQMYSVRAAKNRADIRMALDAYETAVTRGHIGTIAIISGDSDFGALASKLRENGKYILGIGPRQITHALLVRSCDEFLYLENVLGQEPEVLAASPAERENARNVLRGALALFGQRGELPMLATKLKDTMLSMEPMFNETNLGYPQFRAWLEDNGDLVTLFFKGVETYVAPAGFEVPQEFAVAPRREEQPAAIGAQISLAASYRSLISKVFSGDLTMRRDVLRDIYRELSERPGEWTPGTLLDELRARYEAKGLLRSKTSLLKIWQSGFNQRAYTYLGPVSLNAPIRLSDDIDSQAALIRRAESRFVHAVVKTGLEVDRAELAAVLLEDPTQAEYIQDLLDDLQQRGQIERVGERYQVPGRGERPLADDPHLEVLVRDVQAVQLPGHVGTDAQTIRELANRGLAKRTHDFAASAQDYALACRLQWDALERQDPDARLDDMRWLLACYASVKAGELSQVQRRYADARPYYLAFFALVQENTLSWNRMRGLINPMLHFYWRNLAREMGIELEFTTSPVSLAQLMVLHGDPELRRKWREATQRLAQVNPDVLRRVAGQIGLGQEDSQFATQVAEEIGRMLENQTPDEGSAPVTEHA